MNVPMNPNKQTLFTARGINSVPEKANLSYCKWQVMLCTCMCGKSWNTRNTPYPIFFCSAKDGTLILFMCDLCLIPESHPCFRYYLKFGGKSGQCHRNETIRRENPTSPQLITTKFIPQLVCSCFFLSG